MEAFFYSYVDPIHSWHLTRQLKKEDLDLRTLLFSWFLCPVFYGIKVGLNCFPPGDPQGVTGGWRHNTTLSQPPPPPQFYAEFDTYSLQKLFLCFFMFVVCRFCTSKQSFGYVLLDLARCVFIEVFVRDWPKAKIWLESFWRPQISQNIWSFGRSKSDLWKRCNAAGVV